MDEKEFIAAVDETEIFRAYVDLINAERGTMWARHNALLVANSLIFSAIAISQTERLADLALIGAGLVISFVWLFVTREGWAAVHRHVEIAAKLKSPVFANLPNPFSAEVYGRSQTIIYRLMLVVIFVFIAMYLGLGVLRLD